MIEEQEPKFISQRYINGHFEKEYQVYIDGEWAIYKIRIVNIYPQPISPFPVRYGVGRVDGLCHIYEAETMTFESAAKALERILKGTNNE